ncbi:MAG: class A beta-lactamase [Phenylobacterium sp.]
MSRLQSLAPSDASLGSAILDRRGVLTGGASLVLAACSREPPLTASRTPPLKMDALNTEVAALAQRALPGVLGVGLMNLESGEHFTWQGDRPFPMQSVFKLPLGAAVLAEVDAGRLALSETLTVTPEALSPPWSPIADAYPARSAYTIDELLTAAVGESDNTAADMLMKRIGGPGAVTAWLVAQHIVETRVDRYERDVQCDVAGMASFRPAWKGAAFGAAKAGVPPERRRAAMLAYMADPRDTTTPRSMLTLLKALDAGGLISAQSTRKLLAIMLRGSRGNDRLRAGLPADASFAHKPGTSGTDQGLSAAFNDVGIFTLKDRRSYAAAAFLSGSTASDAERAALFADLARAMVRNVG